MASGGSKSVAFILLIVNVILYFIVTAVAAWAVNHGIQRARETASVLQIPARIFPIYLPVGNMATGFFVIFSLIAGVVGMATSLTGLNHVAKWDAPNLHTAAATSLLTWSLTLLAMGLACKEIELGWTDSHLRTLEVITIVVTATQLFCTGAIHAGVEEIARRHRSLIGRV
ncbi:membrane protein PM19L [Alnus glutinosa]|uniref:membrane protein PM19L n=1 Tax=Alnus glutinosa TaxID=3517 RepID=UPI002D781D56|nr:membrane protein PM19L [Alnus glutinosa]